MQPNQSTYRQKAPWKQWAGDMCLLRKQWVGDVCLTFHSVGTHHGPRPTIKIVCNTLDSSQYSAFPAWYSISQSESTSYLKGSLLHLYRNDMMHRQCSLSHHLWSVQEQVLDVSLKKLKSVLMPWHQICSFLFFFFFLCLGSQCISLDKRFWGGILIGLHVFLFWQYRKLLPILQTCVTPKHLLFTTQLLQERYN